MRLLEQTIASIQPHDQDCRVAARARLEQLTMPHWALGSLLDLAVDLAGMKAEARPTVANKAIVTMAGDHGVAACGVSNCPQEVTHQMVRNFVNGGAGVNVLARHAGATVVVVDMGVAHDLSDLVNTGKIISKPVARGTANMAEGPAMSRQQAIQSVEAGIEIATDLAASIDVFGTGEMGIGNTTPSSAIVSVLTGRPVAEVTGRGSGISSEALERKITTIEKAIEINQPDANDGLDILAKVGGFEIGGIAGLILGAAAARRPVIVDGFISTAGALIAHALCPRSADYMIAAHRSVEQGHVVSLERLGKSSLLNLNLRLGEGTGAALAMHLVEASIRVMNEITTFEEAAVTTRAV